MFRPAAPVVYVPVTCSLALMVKPVSLSWIRRLALLIPVPVSDFWLMTSTGVVKATPLKTYKSFVVKVGAVVSTYLKLTRTSL
ncbi:hypothetical protein [Streptococcus suis]|uniref:hypothetical protein n=1 Tax=Streptococcus suis TaxID=1307 RepID=UPI0013D907A2|nr:hypothetical protein [Streptococcus suis]MBY5025574.1 hypothetical protein [Streptococcus suis]MBY5036529.1 hypothetical protein [Streptococcus suis]MCQ8262874.1 hypothetical protein [Streptococcus suis]MCQ9226475.1 hypothetical protein [Streptococcus suis]MCQ9228130.1 hypothetical protein [Streptococcus suis]